MPSSRRSPYGVSRPLDGLLVLECVEFDLTLATEACVGMGYEVAAYLMYVVRAKHLTEVIVLALDALELFAHLIYILAVGESGYEVVVHLRVGAAIEFEVFCTFQVLLLHKLVGIESTYATYSQEDEQEEYTAPVGLGLRFLLLSGAGGLCCLCLYFHYSWVENLTTKVRIIIYLARGMPKKV